MMHPLVCLLQLGFPRERVLESVRNGKFDDVHATYNLLEERRKIVRKKYVHLIWSFVFQLQKSESEYSSIRAPAGGGRSDSFCLPSLTVPSSFGRSSSMRPKSECVYTQRSELEW